MVQATLYKELCNWCRNIHIDLVWSTVS